MNFSLISGQCLTRMDKFVGFFSEVMDLGYSVNLNYYSCFLEAGI